MIDLITDEPIKIAASDRNELSCTLDTTIIMCNSKIDTKTHKAGFKGGGKLGSCPGASTTKGPPKKIDIFSYYYNCKCMEIIAFEGRQGPPIMIVPRASTY